MDDKLRRAIQQAKSGANPNDLLQLAQALEQSGTLEQADLRPSYPILMEWGLMKIKPYHLTCVALECDAVLFPWEMEYMTNTGYEFDPHEHEFNYESVDNITSASRAFPNQERAWVPYYYSTSTRSYNLTITNIYLNPGDVMPTFDREIADWVAAHPKEMTSAHLNWKLTELRDRYDAYQQKITELAAYQRDVQRAASDWLNLL